MLNEGMFEQIAVRGLTIDMVKFGDMESAFELVPQRQGINTLIAEVVIKCCSAVVKSLVFRTLVLDIVLGIEGQRR